MKRTQSKPEDSHFPLRVALPPAPKWRRRRPTPDPSRGRPEQVRVELRLIVPGEGTTGID
jgi:hypothetical protein